MVSHSRSNCLRASFAILLTLLASGRLTSAQEQPAQQRSTRVLFIGNSYTYFNNLPEIFSRLAEDARQGGVETQMIAPGGWRLKDHWEKGRAREAVRTGKWDFVVLQEQSTLGVNYYLEGRPRIAGDATYQKYAAKWCAAIRKSGATPVMYLTWAREATPGDQLELNHAYMRAALAGQALVAPVGIAWSVVQQQQPAIGLYYSDGSHPSAAGSYLAACTLYATIFKQSPIGLPGKINGIPVNLDTGKPEPEKTADLIVLPSGQARFLQMTAWAAWSQLATMGGYTDTFPVPVQAPALAPLPTGMPLSAVELEGTWSGELLFYPAPFLPSEMILTLHHTARGWQGRLEIRFHTKGQTDESINLDNLHVGKQDITFVDPAGLQNLRIRFRGVRPQAGELRGTAEATSGSSDPPIHLLGTWKLHKAMDSK